MDIKYSTPMEKPNLDPFAERLKQNATEPPEATLTQVLPESGAPLAPSVPSTEEIAISDGSMQLDTIGKVWRAAKLIRQSGLCPTSFRNDQQVVIAILRAIELKLPIFQALEGMTVIQNKIGIMGDLALALVQSSGLLEKKTVT